jgi:hypothetical protein
MGYYLSVVRLRTREAQLHLNPAIVLRLVHPLKHTEEQKAQPGLNRAQTVAGRSGPYSVLTISPEGPSASGGLPRHALHYHY